MSPLAFLLLDPAVFLICLAVVLWWPIGQSASDRRELAFSASLRSRARSPRANSNAANASHNYGFDAESKIAGRAQPTVRPAFSRHEIRRAILLNLLRDPRLNRNSVYPVALVARAASAL